eukprot:SAG11_NODE_3542_length_2380_cov_1.640509_1_plen_22_part_10
MHLVRAAEASVLKPVEAHTDLV